MPESPADGPEGKKVICNMPISHPYQLAFRKGLQKIADLHDIQLEIYDTDWDGNAQGHFTEMAIAKDPDLIIHMPTPSDKALGIYQKIHSKRIPVISCNMVPSPEDFPYILSWTGPDDWSMSRALARKFAEFMDYQGGYTLIQHYEGSSCNYARTWGIITELKKIAPDMVCLDYCSTGMKEDRSYQQSLKWLKTFGKKMKGIVSADSLLVQRGIIHAMKELHREDLICVTHWSPPQALEFIRRGVLKATTYQSGIIDGILAIQTAVDWFNGFDIPPVKYMPVHIITKEDVDIFLNKKNEFPILDYSKYITALKTGNAEGISTYFNELYNKINECSLITLEYCRGVAIEILSRLISTITEKGFNREGIVGGTSPAMLANYLFHQRSFDKTLQWLEKISLEYCTTLSTELPGRTPIEKIVKYVDTHFNEALSLKTLSFQFDITAAYLGQIFKKKTGKSFSVYLNDIRIEHARQLLENPHLKEYEVAREIGYTDAGYFYKIFKKQCGMNPSEFREKLRNSRDREL